MTTLKTTVISEMIFDYDTKEDKSSNLRVQYLLEVSKNMIREKYIDKEDLPTQIGSVAITETLVSVLAANIHLAHQKGWRDSAEHFRDIIQKLELKFVDQVKITTGFM